MGYYETGIYVVSTRVEKAAATTRIILQRETSKDKFKKAPTGYKREEPHGL